MQRCVRGIQFEDYKCGDNDDKKKKKLMIMLLTSVIVMMKNSVGTDYANISEMEDDMNDELTLQ